MGIVDKAGSGVDKIVKGWFEQCLYLPQVKENRDPARVIWKLPYLGLLPLEKQKYLIHKIGSDKYAALSLAERIILIMIPEDHYVGHKEIRKSYSIHPTDLSKCLSKLTRNGYLKTQGVARSTKYCMAFSCQKNPESLAQSEESLAQSEESLAQSEESLAQSEESLAQSAAVRDILGLKWIPRAKMEKAILHLCTNRWVSCIQIASLFRRKPKSLQQNILRPLADHGLLELKYPETPNRPRQAYRTTSREADGIKKSPKDRK